MENFIFCAVVVAISSKKVYYREYKKKNWIWFILLSNDIFVELARVNPGSNYFHFPDGQPNSLAPQFKNDFNKDFMSHTE